MTLTACLPENEESYTERLKLCGSFKKNNLFKISLDGAEIEAVDSITCEKLCDDNITDPSYFIKIIERCHKIEKYLESCYGPEIFCKVKNRNKICYTGAVSVGKLEIDLDTCSVEFKKFVIKCEETGKAIAID